MRLADVAEAWLRHGEGRCNVTRSTMRDYRQALDAYLLPAPARVVREPRPFAEMPLRELTADVLKALHDALPHGRTAATLLMVSAILEQGASAIGVSGRGSGTRPGNICGAAPRPMAPEGAEFAG